MEGVENESERSTRARWSKYKAAQRERRRPELCRRADGGVILLCTHYFSFPDIIVWEMDITADIIAFIVNFPLYNSPGSAPSRADEMLTG